MVTQQYLASCYLPDHPGNKHLERPLGRNIKKVILEHKPAVDPLFYMPEASDLIYKEALKSIHTKSVGDAISKYKNNVVLGVLGAVPPEIDKIEKTLSRNICYQLA